VRSFLKELSVLVDTPQPTMIAFVQTDNQFQLNRTPSNRVDITSRRRCHTGKTSSMPVFSLLPIGMTPHAIRITYKVWERSGWRTSHSLNVDPSDPSEVERVAVKYMRKRIRLFDTELNILTPQGCFEAATADGRNIILLIPKV